MSETCPACDNGKLHPTSSIQWISVVGCKEHLPVTTFYSICDGCGSEITSPDQINRNAQQVRNARNDII